MSFKKIVGLSLFISFLFNCKNNEKIAEISKINPIPQEQIMSEGHFILNQATGFSTDSIFPISEAFLLNFIEKGSNFKLEESNDIQFIKDLSISNEEGYILNISPKHIQIKAATDQGAFYGVQTLRQLLPVAFENGSFSDDTVKIPCQLIKDAPQFPYRGMHLDVSRHMFSVAFIKSYIDAIAMLKMNTFHWHLTDDQGWRIEIKSYPKLQEVAAFRDETLIGHYSDQPHRYDGQNYGGYYTQDQIKEIVAYAASRHVTVIPEIEMPGHAQAAIAAYPNLGCSGEAVNVAQKWGVFETIYCSKDETFTFLENVLDEVCDLFPSKYVHIGGDEAPKTAWKSCDSCQSRITSEALSDEHELQNYFITRIEKYLNSKGKQIIGWDEILEGGLAPNATVMSWRGTEGAIEAARQKHQVIMTPTSHCYFDYYQSTNENEPLAIGGYLPLEKVYHFDPIPEELTASEATYILGAQGNLWTEYIQNEDQLEYMVFPRILAMSEVVWSHPNLKNYDNFIERLEHFHSRLNALDINYANHLYEIDGKIISKNNDLYYELSTLSTGKDIRVSLNGDEPHLSSRFYTNPIHIDTSKIIKAAVFKKDTLQKLGPTFTKIFNFHRAVGKSISIDKTPHASYAGSGPEGLINSISGSDKRFGDKEWLGFWGDDIEITIDLGEELDIHSVATRFHNGNGQWIYAPKKVSLELDNDLLTHSISQNSSILVPVSFDVQQRSRYIKLRIPNYGIIPDGKQGAGNKAWTFIDEIIVN
ncbi:glycoside hydrolase family 20 protein [Psychroserpens sp. BH13MA-6]